jgi:general L-amino acid transport system permease protein
LAAHDVTRPGAAGVNWLYDPKVRGVIYQVIVAVVLVAFVWWVATNTITNLVDQNKTTGFDFLWRTAGFEVSFTLVGFNRASIYWIAFLSGLVNTLLISVIGIILASIMGFTVGIARLSSNWIVSRLATVYVEIVRNVPLLLQLFIWYFGVLKTMPPVRESVVLFDSVALNLRGLYVPRPITDDRFLLVVLAFLVAVAASFVLGARARRKLESTGQKSRVFLPSLALIVVLPVVTFFVVGASLEFEVPVLQGFNYRGGISLPPELVALVIGLSMYHAAFIGETVRGGILAISYGQTEAAQSLGLSEGERLRLVIIPQALRVIIPPVTSQYLNVIKNSSLGAAIGFPEFVSVFLGTTLNQTGKAIEVVLMTMLVYLTFSLTTSAFMNWYNARVALVER